MSEILEHQGLWMNITQQKSMCLHINQSKFNPLINSLRLLIKGSNKNYKTKIKSNGLSIMHDNILY